MSTAAEDLCDQALELFEAGELDKAEQLWLKAAAKGSGLAHRNLGMNAKESQDLDLAIERFGQALALGDTECAGTLLELVSERIAQLDLPQGLNREALSDLVRIVSLAGPGPTEKPDSPNQENTLWARALVDELLSTEIGENERSRIGVLASALNIEWPEYPKFEGNWGALEWLTCTLADLGRTLSADEVDSWLEQVDLVPEGARFLCLGALTNPGITTEHVLKIVELAREGDTEPALLAVASAIGATPEGLRRELILSSDPAGEWVTNIIGGWDGWARVMWTEAYGRITPTVIQSSGFWRTLLTRDDSGEALISKLISDAELEDEWFEEHLSQLQSRMDEDPSLRLLALESNWGPAVNLASSTQALTGEQQ
jgi:hypothetical protein